MRYNLQFSDEIDPAPVDRRAGYQSDERLEHAGAEYDETDSVHARHEQLHMLVETLRLKFPPLFLIHTQPAPAHHHGARERRLSSFRGDRPFTASRLQHVDDAHRLTVEQNAPAVDDTVTQGVDPLQRGPDDDIRHTLRQRMRDGGWRDEKDRNLMRGGRAETEDAGERRSE